jgi:hypothetical protein
MRWWDHQLPGAIGVMPESRSVADALPQLCMSPNSAAAKLSTEVILPSLVTYWKSCAPSADTPTMPRLLRCAAMLPEVWVP